MICKNCNREIIFDTRRGWHQRIVHCDSGEEQCNMFAEPMIQLDIFLDAKQILSDLDAREKARRRQPALSKRADISLDEKLWNDCEVIQ